MSVINQNLLLTPEGYQISRSVRLRSSASAYFNRTPASAGNRKTWTWSGWVKRGTLGVASRLFAADDGSASTDQDYNTLLFNSSNQLQFSGNLTDFRITSAVYRDPSAWYHIVLATDTTQATAANRFKLYVNGSEVTAFGTSNNPSQNTDLAVNASIGHYIGSIAGSSYLDGYLTEVNFIDGQALTPSSFGETDAVTGVWKPKKYAGTYGTNGFYLNFSDNSAATAAAIGKDYSGNGNNWTPNNISVTSGVTYDSMLDVPTMWADGGSGRGNYCTWNPTGGTTSSTYSNANLTVSRSAGSTATVISTMAMQSGAKYYFEMSPASVSAAYPVMGIQNIAINTGANANPSAAYQANGVITVNGTDTSGFSTFTSNDIIGVAFDPSTGKCWFSKNGTWQNGDPVAGTITTPTVSTSIEWCPAVGTYSAVGAITLNCGQRPFAYTPPTGFKALNTQNLPDATIKKGNAYFDATTYTGNASTNNIVNSGAMQPDLVWIKNRGGAFAHYLTDAVRGAYQVLYSNLTNAEYNGTSNSDSVSSFNSNGFTVLGGLNRDNYNQSSNSYVAWQWKESASAGFDIVTYTGTGVARTVAHSLGVAPKMMIVKNRGGGGVDGWVTYHQSIGNTGGLILNSTGATTTTPLFWNNTSPTSSVFSVSTSTGVNANGNNYVAYLFAEVAGFSKFGSYTGNGSADGPFVYCGFRPKFVLMKCASSIAGWVIWDTSRNTYNATDELLIPNSSGAAITSYPIDLLSNGFKIRSIDGAYNSSGGTYIFAAFAENPFKNSLAR